MVVGVAAALPPPSFSSSAPGRLEPPQPLRSITMAGLQATAPKLPAGTALSLSQPPNSGATDSRRNRFTDPSAPQPFPPGGSPLNTPAENNKLFHVPRFAFLPLPTTKPYGNSLKIDRYINRDYFGALAKKFRRAPLLAEGDTTEHFSRFGIFGACRSFF